MKGDFKITLQFLKDIGACRDGQREFQKAFPEGAGYQEVLDRCANEGRPDFGKWLLNKLGPTDDIRTFEENVEEPERIIIFAGNLEFKLGVSAKLIVSGCGIEAGEGIEAGCGIKAGEGIEAGEGYGVFAGIHIKISLWCRFAIVSAKQKPKNLISGYWVETDEKL